LLEPNRVGKCSAIGKAHRWASADRGSARALAVMGENGSGKLRSSLFRYAAFVAAKRIQRDGPLNSIAPREALAHVGYAPMPLPASASLAG